MSEYCGAEVHSKRQPNLRSAALLSLLGFFPLFLWAGAAFADVTGTVFRDYDSDGVQDALEPGVPGATVTTYGSSGALGTGTTVGDGTYSVTGGAPSEAVRVEITLPASLDFLRPGVSGADSATTLTFVTMPADGSDAAGIDVALANPSDYCQAVPDLVTSCYVDGDQSGSLDTLVSFAYTASGQNPTPPVGDEATESDIGTTFGLAYQRSSDTLFAASYMKRHSGFGDSSADGTGVIYQIDDPDDGVVGAISQFLNLNTLFGSQVAGANPHPAGSDFTLDAASFPLVGKLSLGDMDISEDELTLWVVNLADRQLYEIPLGTDPANPVAPVSSTEVDTFPLYDLLDCDDDGAVDLVSDIDLRPFAVEVQDGLIYLGLTCTAESTQATADLSAAVFTFDPDTDTFANVLQFDLDYARGCILADFGTCLAAANSANWNPWQSSWPVTGVINLGGTVTEYAFPQPLLTDLDFAEDGTLLLGMRDRFGDQMGYLVPPPDNSGNSRADAAGDILRATPNGLGGFNFSTVEATNGTEFFFDDDWTDTRYSHAETAFGGVVALPGTGEIVTTLMDPVDGAAPLDNDFSAGMRWMSLATGVVNQAYEVYDSQAAFFGKANGLGDLEAICEPAPLEIGNRVWCDEGDGVQDPGEAGIAGLTVTLVCDTDGNGTLGGGSDLNVTTVTDGSGQYLFNNGNVVGGIPVRTTCQVRVSRVAVNGSCGDVAEATVINASSGTNSDIRDSDGGDVTGTAVVSGDTVGVEFTTGAAGDVNHTFDLGFRPSLGAPNPGALDIEKVSIPSGPVVAGQTYAYSILVTNNSGITHTGIELFANPPAGLSYVAESTSATGPRTVITNLQVRDNFGTVAFDNQDGSDNWSSDWIEDDAETLGAAAGNVQITGGQLRFDDQPNTGTEPSAAREVDLSGLSTATFTFDFATSAGVDPTDAVTVEVSSNGGASYTTLEVITGLDDVNTGSRSFDISGSIAANTRIRFRVTNLYGGGNEFFFVDNVQIIASGSATSVDTLDNDPVSAAPALVDGAPLNLIEPADFFTLAPGESMTVTFQVTVDSPIAAGVTEFLCPATVNSNEGPPASDFAVNPVADGPGIIGDFVWFDIDGDGVQDPGEPGIPGAQVNLHAANNCDGPVLETTTTDANGLYVFSSLPAGDYCVEVYEATLPDGYFSTTGNNPTVLTLPSGATDDTVDFGYEAVACLPDIGFEVDALGQTIYPGQVIDSEFSAWGVGISAVAGGGGVNELMVFNSSSPTGGDDDLGTPNVEFGGPGIGGGGAAGAPFENRFDLGNIGIISANGDETNPNDNAGGGTITVTFDRDVEIDELGFVDNGDTLGVDGGEIRLFNAGAVQIGAGIAIPGVGDNGVSVVSSIGGVGVRSVEVELFGSGGLDVLRTCGLPELTGALGDRVWLDTDGDGLQDVGEPGIPNVEVTLFDVGPNGTVGGGDDIAVATTTTDTNGLYLFDGLPPGTFYVDVTDATVPTGLALSPGNADPGAAVVLAEGALDLDSDFGYSNASAVTGVIGDTVWSDPDADGLLDPGEPGIAGVTVDLVSAGADGIFGTVDDVVEDTATTGADGRYLFVGVAAGKYRVDVTDTGNVLTGYTLTAGPQSNPDPSYAINLAAGETYLLADFGYDNNALFSIDDTAWVDIDRDGVLDPGESGIPGVTVSLLDGSGNAIASTVTDANGDFSFDGLPNGSYTLQITDTDFVLNGFETTTSPAAAGQQAVTIAGADVSGTNFGYVRPGVVGDTVWSDADGDGVQDPDEAGIPGVTVQIFYDLNGNGALDVATDTVVETAVTDAFGRYVFERLFPGTYVVSIDDTQPALTGFTHTTADSQAAAGDQLDATLSSADLADLDNDFGYRNTALADISGTVFHDIDRDGFDDGVGEPGLAGVTVELRDASGNPIAKALTDA
ncbi:MAG: SdrD B-like domain-containing protein, partial [Acidobacteriota bacterium]